ncbi:MAG: metal ABC transporter substrate-binding protein [Peptococcaceae bacterium]|nr:metal ABC transporter substrate-binding protein [Peptococcaceae bacterium]
MLIAWLTLTLGLGLLAGCGSPVNSSVDEGALPDGRLSVYASFYTMYDFAVKIGGDQVSVTNMVPAGTEPHDWEPAASDMIGLEKAAVFIYNGAGMEHWAETILGSLQNKELLVVEASKGLPLLHGSLGEEEETAAGREDETEGVDPHVWLSPAVSALCMIADTVDPHVWLSPLNAKAEMENIKNAFVRADPEHAADYEANYARYAAELEALDQEFRETLAALTHREVIVAHQAFGYLCAAYGLKQIPIDGLSPDSEPDPARVAEIIDFAKEHEVKVIFFEELVSPKVAAMIASAVGARTDQLNPLEGLSDEERAAGADYFSVMRQNMEALKAALE